MKTYYELQQPGLGEKFENEIKQALKRIESFLDAFPLVIDEIRKYTLHRFPYKIYFCNQNDVIVILAIAHQHSIPFYWVNRDLNSSKN